MKKNIVLYILIVFLIFLILLLLNVIYSLNINYIKQDNSEVEVIGEKVLLLKDKQDEVYLPHLNIKGKAQDINSDYINIELSDYAKSYLKTEQIKISSKKIKLEKNQKVFLKIKDIKIKDNKLYYSSVELYTYTKSIKKNHIKKDFYICKNDYGGFMKVKGKSFKYKNNVYFLSNQDLSENNEVYFINIKNGNLLIEEIKSLVPPFKVYNMINPQETKFNEIVKIYK